MTLVRANYSCFQPSLFCFASNRRLISTKPCLDVTEGAAYRQMPTHAHATTSSPNRWEAPSALHGHRHRQSSWKSSTSFSNGRKRQQRAHTPQSSGGIYLYKYKYISFAGTGSVEVTSKTPRRLSNLNSGRAGELYRARARILKVLYI